MMLVIESALLGGLKVLILLESFDWMCPFYGSVLAGCVNLWKC
jgi:hypothetical protein